MNKITADDEYARNADVLNKEDVREIQEWIKTQPHLPQITELEVILFLHSNYYDLEATKKTIENYYTMRTHNTEFFSSRDVTTAELQETLRVFNAGVMPTRTKEGDIVVFFKLRETDPKLSTNANNIKIMMMMFDILLIEHGTHSGVVMLFDMEGMSWGHFLKASFSESRKHMNYVQEAFPIRLKRFVHFNLPSFYEKVLAIFRPFMKESLLKLLVFASSIEETYQWVPPECFPSDYPNGTGPSVEELHETTNAKLLAYRDYFMEEERTKRVDESQRIKKKSFWNYFY